MTKANAKLILSAILGFLILWAGENVYEATVVFLLSMVLYSLVDIEAAIHANRSR